MKSLFLFLIISLLLISCQSEQKPQEDNTAVEDSTSNVQAPEPDPEPQKAQEADLTTAEGFIAAFKEAFANKDIDALNAMSDLEHEVYTENFLESFMQPVEELKVDAFQKATHEADTWQFQLEVENGSAMLFYLQRIDGQYTIVQALGIG